MFKALLKLYVRILNKDPGTKLSVYDTGNGVQVRGPMRYLVTAGISSGKPRDVAKALVVLDQKAKRLLDTMEPITRTVASMIEQGVPLEMIIDALDEARVQHREHQAGRA